MKKTKKQLKKEIQKELKASVEKCRAAQIGGIISIQIIPMKEFNKGNYSFPIYEFKK